MNKITIIKFVDDKAEFPFITKIVITDNDGKVKEVREMGVKSRKVGAYNLRAQKKELKKTFNVARINYEGGY